MIPGPWPWSNLLICLAGRKSGLLFKSEVQDEDKKWFTSLSWFLMPTANRKISENFKLIDPLLGGGAPKEENYIEYDGKKYSGFVFDIPGGGAPPEGNIGSELNFQSGITTTGAKKRFYRCISRVTKP